MADPVSIGITLALNAASMAMTASRKIEGPRLDDLSVTVADYGTSLNYFYGKRRLAGCPIIWAEPLREVEVEHKTKGGKYNQFQYFATFAFVVADHPIEAVSRIWFDKHLVYDATGAGPVTPFLPSESFSIADSMRVYLGSEDQLPDPRMLATVEAANGAGSCPAYRGVSYVVFEELPVEKFGNRIPQISVEGITSTTTVYPYEEFEVETVDFTNTIGFSFSPDFSRASWGRGGQYEIWDVAARSPMISGTLPVDGDEGETFGVMGAVSNDGTIYAPSFYSNLDTGHTMMTIYAIPPDGIGAPGKVWDQVDFKPDSTRGSSGCVVKQDGYDVEYVFLMPSSTYKFLAFIADGAPYYEETVRQPTCVFVDGYGDLWVVSVDPGGSGVTECHFERLSDTGARPGSASTGAVTGLSPSDARATAFVYHYMDADVDHFVICWDGDNLYSVDIETFAVTNTEALPTISPTNVPRAFSFQSPGASTIWIDNKQYSSADLSLIRTVDAGDWDGGGNLGFGASIYDPINNAILRCTGDDDVAWAYLDRVGSSGVPLEDIVLDVADRVGNDPADIDASDLDQIIPGYSWSHGSGRNILEPLLDAYDSFIRPHGFGIEAKKRGEATQGTIDVSVFAKADPRYMVKLTQDTDLPRSLTFSFADIDADQQTNSVVVQRPLESVDGKRETTIDMTTLVLDVDTARQLAERWFRRKWFGRKTLENALTAQHLGIEPGDVWTSRLDGVDMKSRLTKLTPSPDGRLTCEWERDDESIAVLSGTTGATMDGREPSVLFIPVISKGFVLDIPLIRDVDNSSNPLIYYAAAPWNSTGVWPGAIVYRSTDGENYDVRFSSVPSNLSATWGFTREVLASANPNLWDRGSEITITLKNGTLTSTTEALCNANPALNLCLLGNELLQFTTATLNIDGTWTLSGFKRGRRGTERECNTHEAGEYFLLLDKAQTASLGASDIGVNQYWKVPTSGRELTSAFPIRNEPFAGATLRPYAPCHAFAVKLDNGDWQFNWIRRTRVGGAWTGGTPIPVSEATEAYEIDIFAGLSTYVKETTSPEYLYTVAEQTADDGAEIMALDGRVYQMSDAIGRGTHVGFEVLS